MGEISVETRTYKDGEQELEGVLVQPKNAHGKLPTVLVFHALFGRTEHEEETAKQLGKLGFVAFAADVYGKDVKPQTREEAFEVLGKFRSARSTLLRNRLLAALNFVKSLPNVDHEKIASIGFCFGGMCSLDLARINAVSSAVSFHGAFQPIDGETDFEKLEPIQTKILVAHGDEDAHVNPTVDAFIDELRGPKGGLPVPHRFEGIPGVGYHEPTAKRSKLAMLLLFNELYGLPQLSDLKKA
ncbi:DLH domain-containing protein [Aphelenchoides fujianensis]|nr:DLH domain-containing protein [Aphelenchoides fujianensis]